MKGCAPILITRKWLLVMIESIRNDGSGVVGREKPVGFSPYCHPLHRYLFHFTLEVDYRRGEGRGGRGNGAIQWKGTPLSLFELNTSYSNEDGWECQRWQSIGEWNMASHSGERHCVFFSSSASLPFLRGGLPPHYANNPIRARFEISVSGGKRNQTADDHTVKSIWSAEIFELQCWPSLFQ